MENMIRLRMSQELEQRRAINMAYKFFISTLRCISLHVPSLPRRENKK